MIGRILLVILGIFLALLVLLAVLLALPAGARVCYDRGELAVWVRCGPVRVQVLPSKKKDGSETKKPKKEKKAKKAKGKKPEADGAEKEKKKFSVNMDQISYSLDKLPPILGRALRGVGRSIRLDPLKVHLLVAGADPADTALLYSKLEASLTVGVPAAERLMRIRNQDIRLFVDFTEERPDVIADVGVSVRPWALVIVALRAGVGALGWFLGFRKLASKAPKDAAPQEKPDDTKENKAA